ncbi:hypothetical protein [Herbaspirillum sp. C7C8]|uniref:hypothetical protein n=1 Tax=Herbaspirillum sp. C7C8 TaxID=2736665 RepID=UPI001F5157CE|nr:hypothetical protein [Herbaspirillum sp. C7C8]
MQQEKRKHGALVSEALVGSPRRKGIRQAGGMLLWKTKSACDRCRGSVAFFYPQGGLKWSALASSGGQDIKR